MLNMQKHISINVKNECLLILLDSSRGGRMGKGEEKELYQKLLTTVTIKWKVTENNRNDYENVNIDYKISVRKKK